MSPDWFRQVRSAWSGVFGLPDYDAYLRHMAERHPDQVPLGRNEFSRRFIDHRYGGMKSRCC